MAITPDQTVSHSLSVLAVHSDLHNIITTDFLKGSDRIDYKPNTFACFTLKVNRFSKQLELIFGDLIVFDF